MIDFNDFVVGEEYSYDLIEKFNEGIDDSINGWSPKNDYEYIEYGDEMVGHIIYIQHIDTGTTLVFLLIKEYERPKELIYKCLGKEDLV